MRKVLLIATAQILFGVLASGAMHAESAIIGVNVYNEGSLSHPEQDAEIEQLVAGGVKTIRTGLGTNSIYFITQAFHRGIGSIVIVYPHYGSKAKPIGRWSRIPLSGCDPQ